MYLRITGGTDNRRQISDWPRYIQRGSFPQRMIYIWKRNENTRVRQERENRTNNLSDHWFFSIGPSREKRWTGRVGRGLNGATIFFFDSFFIFIFFSFPPPFFPVSARRNSRCVSRNAIIPDDYVEHDNIISSYDHSFATGSGFIPARQRGLHDLLSKLNRDFALTLFSASRVRVTRVHACAPMETHAPSPSPSPPPSCIHRAGLHFDRVPSNSTGKSVANPPRRGARGDLVVRFFASSKRWSSRRRFSFHSFDATRIRRTSWSNSNSIFRFELYLDGT